MEIIGVIGTVFIIIAFSLSGELKIRLFDLIGALLFIVYGVIIRSFSTVLLNGLLTIIQCYKIYKLYKTKEM